MTKNKDRSSKSKHKEALTKLRIKKIRRKNEDEFNKKKEKY